MKNITVSLIILISIFLTSCGGEGTTSGPFSGKIDFTAGAMGINTNGSITIDATQKKITYRLDALQQMMGMDIVTMMDLKNMVSYSISPSKKIYTKQDIPMDEVSGDMPSDKEMEKAKEELFSHLKSTGNTETINGYTCEEYEITKEIEGLESGTIWFSKSLLDRLSPIWSDIPELKEIDFEDFMLGFPMKGSGMTAMGGGQFEITKITEGEEGLDDLSLDDYTELDQEEFMAKVMEGTALGNMFGGLDDMEESLDDYSDFEEEMEAAMDEIDFDEEELEKAIQEALEEVEGM